MKSKSPARKARRRVVFLFDVDNTLLNNDRVIEDLRAHLTAEVGEKIWKGRITTVFVRQGHYAQDAKILTSCPPADLEIPVIGDLMKYDLRTLTEAGMKAAN
jgi:hypothetical protein